MSRLINPNRVAGHLHDISTLQGLSSNPCNVLFVSDQVMYILANYAVKDVKFLSRYATSYPNENQATVIDQYDSEVPFVEDVIERFQLETSGDNVEIATAINNVAQAILAQVQCCDGPTSTGTGGASGQETTPSSGVDNGNNPPVTTSFGTYSEYQTYKCNVANYIVDASDATANAMQTLAWNSILTLPIAEIIVILAATFATPIPGDEIIALVSILALWGGAFTPVFDNLEDAIDNHRQSLICALFEAPDVETAKDDFRTALNAAIDGESTPGGLLNTVTKGVAAVFITTDGLNALFTEDDARVYPVGNCASCNAASIQWVLGLNGLPRGSGDLTPDGTQRVLASTEDSNGLHYISFKADITENSNSYFSNCDDVPPELVTAGEENFDVIYHSSTVSTQTDAFRCAPGVHTRMWGPNVPGVGVPFNISWTDWINIAAAGPFTLTITIGPAGTL